MGRPLDLCPSTWSVLHTGLSASDENGIPVRHVLMVKGRGVVQHLAENTVPGQKLVLAKCALVVWWPGRPNRGGKTPASLLRGQIWTPALNNE